MSLSINDIDYHSGLILIFKIENLPDVLVLVADAIVLWSVLHIYVQEDQGWMAEMEKKTDISVIYNYLHRAFAKRVNQLLYPALIPHCRYGFTLQ